MNYYEKAKYEKRLTKIFRFAMLIFIAIVIIMLLSFTYIGARQVFLPAILMLLFFLLLPFLIYFLYGKIHNLIPIKTMDEYQKLITIYMKQNHFVEYLENSCIKILWNRYEIKILNKVDNQLYHIISSELQDNKILPTVWAIIQMYFNEKVTYESLMYWTCHIDNIKIENIELST